MYQVTFKDKSISESVIFDTRLDDKNYQIFNPKIEDEINKSGNFTFDIYPLHIYYDKLKKMQGIIKVYNDSKIIFRGRVLDDTLLFNRCKNIYCEGELAFLNDSIVRPYEHRGSVYELFSYLINEHNSQVEEDKKFYIGECTVTDSNDYIYRSSTVYPTVWEELNNKLLNSLGGYLRIRHVDDKSYIDYLSDFNDKCTQEILLEKNMFDLKKDTKAENIATRIIALGAKLKDDDGNETEERLTVKSVNNGLDYVENNEAIKLYGLITKCVYYDDVTEPSNLLRKAEKDLMANIVLNISTEINALDTSLLDKNIQSFGIGLYVRVISTVHNLDDYFLISKISIDLLNPQNNKIVIGSIKNSLTDEQNKSDNNIKVIEKNYIKNEYKEEIKEQFTKDRSLIEQKADELKMEVEEKYVNKDNFSLFQQEIKTTYQQTNEDFQFWFKQITEQINNSDGDTQAAFQMIQKYIRFVDGHIVLGEIGNELTLEIGNNRLSFLQNNVEVAYLSNNKLYITDAEVLSSIRIGNFAFIPRKNGNLSFKYVGGGK